MLWAQWLVLVYACVRLIAILACQGRKVGTSTVDGWNLFFWLLGVALLFCAGAFSGIFGAP